MKNFLVLGLLASLLALFFACSNDGLDVRDPSLKSSCVVVEEEQEKCYDVSAEICAIIGGDTEKACPASSSSSPLSSSSSSLPEEFCEIDGYCLPWTFGEEACLEADGLFGYTCEEGSSSSVSDGGSSSSNGATFGCKDGDSCVTWPMAFIGTCTAEGGEVLLEGCPVVSSSSAGGSSSSHSSSSSGPHIPEPIVTGEFVFRNFSYSSGSSGVYYLNTSMHTSANDVGTSNLHNSLVISNKNDAICGDITIEISGGGLTSIPGVPNQIYTSAEGQITAIAVATCNETRKELKTATATVVPDPVWTCSLPSSYIHKDESITNAVSIEHNYDRCNNGTAAYSLDGTTFAASLNLASRAGQTLNITSRLQCSGVQQQKACSPTPIYVAENIQSIGHTNNFSVSSNGGTIIVISFSGVLPHKVGCNGGAWANGCVDTQDMPILNTHCGYFSFNINKTQVLGRYWGDTSLDIENYSNNGNRILFETNQGAVTSCQLIRP